MPNLSTFPTNIDTFVTHVDISPSDAANITRWKELNAKSDKTEAEITEYAQLSETLSNKIFDADDLNKLQDCITNLEEFFSQEVEGYIGTKQDEFQSEIDKFTLIGEYSSTTAYVKKNIVQRNGEAFVCKQDCMGQAPTAGHSNEYWGIIAKQGIQGVSGTGLSWRGVYNAETEYYTDDCVTTGYRMYYAKQNAFVGQTPSLDSEYWGVAFELDLPVDMGITWGQLKYGFAWTETE